MAELLKARTSPVARRIARTAARLFATRGYDATSVREIVEAAGVAKPTLYYYFGSKDGLAHALLTVPLTELVEELRRIVGTVEDPIACLQQVLAANYATCRDDPDWSRFIYAVTFGPLSTEIAGKFEDCKCDLSSWIEAAIRRLAEAGIVAWDQVDDCSTACRGLLVISTLDHLYQDKPLTADLARRQVEHLLQGFGQTQWRTSRKEEQ